MAARSGFVAFATLASPTLRPLPPPPFAPLGFMTPDHPALPSLPPALPGPQPDSLPYATPEIEVEAAATHLSDTLLSHGHRLHLQHSCPKPLLPSFSD